MNSNILAVGLGAAGWIPTITSLTNKLFQLYRRAELLVKICDFPDIASADKGPVRAPSEEATRTTRENVRTNGSFGVLNAMNPLLTANSFEVGKLSFRPAVASKYPKHNSACASAAQGTRRSEAESERSPNEHAAMARNTARQLGSVHWVGVRTIPS